MEAEVVERLSRLGLASKGRDEVLQMMLDDPMLYGQICLGHHMSNESPVFHYEVMEMLGCDFQFSAVIAPRGHAKSTLVNLIWLSHRLFFGLEPFVVQISETISQSQNFLDTIKQEVESNEMIRYFFGNLKGAKWAAEDVQLSNGCWLVCKGSGQRIRGIKRGRWRPTLFILDDFESETNTLTEENRDRLKKWVDGAVIPSMDINGRLVMIGTIVHEDSYLSDVMRTDEGWAKLFYQALTRNGPLWPQRFTAEKLRRIRDNYDRRGQIDMFFQEYMNVPFSPSSAPLASFKLFETWELTDNRHLKINGIDVGPVSLYRGIDPSTGQSRGDYAADCTIARDSRNNTYIIEDIENKAAPHELIQQIFDGYGRFRHDLMVIEANGFQEMIVAELRAEMIRRRIGIPILEVKSRTSKSPRLMALEPRIRMGRVHVWAQCHQMITQLRTFRPDKELKHEDGLDAYYFAELYAQDAVDNSIPIRERSDGRVRSTVQQWVVA